MAGTVERHAGKSLVWDLLSAYCAQKGLKLTALDDRGHGGFIDLPGGGRRFFRGTHFDLNPLGAAEVADDKAQSLGLLEQDRLPVPAGCLLWGSEESRVKDARTFARDHGFPLFFKPNSGQEGHDVHRAANVDELSETVRILTPHHRLLLLQEEIKGEDLRLVVLDGKVLLAVLREPPYVTGDGTARVGDLVAALHKELPADRRVERELAHQGYDLTTVLTEGTRSRLLPNANLSAGGTGLDITASLSPSLVQTAVRATRALGLRYAGVDLMVTGLGQPGEKGCILEVNAAPGLAQFARQGDAELQVVATVYETVFDALTSA